MAPVASLKKGEMKNMQWLRDFEKLKSEGVNKKYKLVEVSFLDGSKAYFKFSQ